MNYEETVAWLYAQLPMFQRVGPQAFKKDLSRTILLDNHLKNPHKEFHSIHVAGTNGKGSVSSMLAAVYQSAGYKVGLYTSPHLEHFTERIRINGAPVKEQYIVDFVRNYKAILESSQASFFEVTVAMAFDYFRDQKVDLAIVETGMGGRLDSTNILNPILSVITNIGYDHQQFLGDTLEQIAVEKAGIIKPNTPVVIGRFQKETEKVFREKAKSQNAELVFADKNQSIYPSDLHGKFQEENQRTALSALKQIHQDVFKVNEDHIKTGLSKVSKRTGLRGRMDIRPGQPTVLLDAAHNLDGLNELLDSIEDLFFAKLHWVYASVNDKPQTEVLKRLPKNAHYYFCKTSIPRALDPLKLIEAADKEGLDFRTFHSTESALNEVYQAAGPHDLVVIAGSIFLLAEAYPYLESKSRQV